ncbi:MAG: TolC family protein [Algoriphagus sp.]|uniref:TolC family protein n=2 Tax=Algoriphagus sp. TaxID=1872435 RepID=UPI0032990DCD
MKTMKLSIITPISLILLLSIASLSQVKSQTLTLEQCQELALENYPLINQLELIQLSSDYSIENAGKGNLPQLSVSGQATYQSDVTGLPIDIPNVVIQPLAKDQYKVYGEISQSLTDGPMIKNQKALIQANSETQAKQLEVQLYQVKERINQLFFGMMLIDQQVLQTDLLKKDIQTGIKKTSAAVENGTALRSAVDVLKAELLRVDQKSIELQYTRNGYAEMLSLFIGQPISSQTTLIRPAPKPMVQEINRPELAFYQSQKQSLVIQNQLISNRSIPKINLFVQGGYGRPGLNFLSNDFELFYLGGVRLNWNISSFYTSRRERELLDLSSTSIDLLQETFLLNTTITLSQKQQDINKYIRLMQTDQEIVMLRESVKNSASAQLEYGTLTSNDYLTYVNAADQANQDLILHKVQLLMAQYSYQLTSGN